VREEGQMDVRTAKTIAFLIADRACESTIGTMVSQGPQNYLQRYSFGSIMGEREWGHIGNPGWKALLPTFYKETIVLAQ
jgi:hypothetical protein